MKKINLLLIAIALLTFSCSDGTKRESTSGEDNSRIEGKYPSDINSLVSIIDTTLNPFANGLLYSGRDCSDEIESERINCVLSKFPPRPLPMHFGPIPDIDFGSNINLHDSLFIVKILKDTTYFTEDDRTYGYCLGVNIPLNKNFKLVIITEWFSVGKSYILLTISNTGEHIDNLIIGSESSDYESVFGKIESLDNIEVTTKKIGYDEGKDLLYFSSSETVKYSINGNGKILKK